ncbi:uncharacterized protein LOC123869252 [Maniola jurtina]|uniref:uncharacterized protein LOC123869252 n=1 Tax=Maniola jurtina TaxID=191418 RepID=UPI001E68D1F5|nr:uncharacterized protein LOC123869252 [Maniola jurtina]
MARSSQATLCIIIIHRHTSSLKTELMLRRAQNFKCFIKFFSAIWSLIRPEKIKKLPKKQLKKNTSAYLHQREKANARKRKFLDKMTDEEREIKRAKDRAYYQQKKAEKKVKNIAQVTQREQRKQRKKWKEASKKYREKKKKLSSIVNNTPPHSDDGLAGTPSVRRTVGKKNCAEG